MEKEMNSMNLKKTVAVVLFSSALIVAPVVCQQGDQINARAASAVSVGRGRAITENPGRLPGLHNKVHVVARHPKKGCKVTAVCGTIFYDTITTNLVTNAGLNWLADIMSNTSTPSVNAQANYIGLTNSVITPAVSDTTLAGEIAANGLARAQGTYTHSANATTYTIAKTFTCTTAPQAAQAGAVFTAASNGAMVFEDTFTAASLQVNDTLSVTWTITI
jgi:hypothetical protein